ncbi:MAG: tetratricopeptide repeat protein [Gammaproteobacteria bacterium]|nr:tetratricopeptide repeat protein [Gammaproteobacteria bacterium]
MDSKLLQGFYLGDLLIEPLRGRVSGKAGTNRLAPKATEVLLCLAQSPGEVVTRETLLQCAWGDGQGSQEALSHAVGDLRHALGDRADNPKFIQTLPRRGYRLVIAPEPRDARSSSIVLGLGEGPDTSDIGLFENLSRRGVIETAVAYLIAGWLLIQIADIVFAQLHLPEWAGTFVTVLVIAGFPIAVVLSWFFEIRDGRAVVDTSPTVARKRRFTRTYLSVVGALTIAAIGVLIYDKSIGLPSAEPEVAPVAMLPEVTLPPVSANSFAILPFLNLNGTNETQLFADGLVDDVIHQATRIPGLRVAARGDSFSLEPNTPSKQVRERLRVAMYIEGSVEMNAERMRVLVQMIDSETGHHILSRKFDRPREDFFAIRDEITELIIANIRVSLPPKLRSSSLKAVEDPSLNAYTLYRHGINAARQPTSIHTIASALGWFDAALHVDPEYAAAHAGKCTAYVDGYQFTNDPAYIDDAQSSCSQALALNPNLDMVHTALGGLYRATGQWEDAEAAYNKALAIDPSNVESLTWLGTIYARQNRFDEAEASLRKAVDIHPGDSRAYNRLGTFLFRTGRFAEAVEQYEYVVALQPNDMNAYANLGGAYTLVGNFASAALAYKKAIEIEPTENAYSNLGMMQYYLNDTEAAIESLNRAVELQPNDYLARSNLGDALWVGGREPEARREFEKAEALASGALRVNANDPLVTMDLAWIKTALDKHDEARNLIEKALELAPEDPYAHYIDGLMLNRSGNEPETLSAFRAAVEHGYSTVLLANDPNIRNLRGDSRFNEILNLSE